MAIKAIETVYNGFHFRSRLEAQWAVFFDEMGYKYEYEKEGFNLGGTYYLPDFYLNDLCIFFEVKGAEPTEEELKKCKDLSCDKAIAISSGGFSSDEKIKPVLLFGFDMGDSSVGCGEYEIYFLNNPRDGSPVIGTSLSKAHSLRASDDLNIEIPSVSLPVGENYYTKHKNAIKTAKMKRF